MAASLGVVGLAPHSAVRVFPLAPSGQKLPHRSPYKHTREWFSSQ